MQAAADPSRGAAVATSCATAIQNQAKKKARAALTGWIAWGFHMFPRSMTFTCFAVFSSPLWMVIHIGMDPNVAYWMNPYYPCAVLIATLFIVGHTVQAQRTEPDTRAITLSMLIPSLFLLLLSDHVLTQTSDRSGQLFSTDCDAYAGKRALEQSYQAAAKLYSDCLEQTFRLSPSNRTIYQTMALFKIQDCDEYEKAYLRYPRDWSYLRHLEENENCAGWCYSGDPLWSYYRAQDRCSIAASSVLSDKIARLARQAVMSSLIILVFTCLLIIALRPILLLQREAQKAQARAAEAAAAAAAAAPATPEGQPDI
mmetsp:Transcript_10998/g.25125  ORF Transcript_10998/g.25125 Transcript_10998/m.25125 type:complete len:313 (-) Transcript_10998:173-1111(-)|eukprot:CAMPEP_0178435848 /NCGR_PEP_ID=MMETSP0689_2-20121128/34139_1 /TAXON_ID=160604 /ORGANISM="Amphidinium massartii, Strain CS-259" /LENGTH=312 /DNA_ID=CAMNT_0020057933 /DNA_START=89 /DNA_END=1027 /DNA_ORIENTATION=+